jgi:hypothetical protein
VVVLQSLIPDGVYTGVWPTVQDGVTNVIHDAEGAKYVEPGLHAGIPIVDVVVDLDVDVDVGEGGKCSINWNLGSIFLYIYIKKIVKYLIRL